MVFLSCSKDENIRNTIPGNVPFYSVNALAELLPQLRVDSVSTFNTPGPVGPYYLEPFPEAGYVVATDRTEKEIHLFDENGTHVSKAGGEGRGPGEFMGAVNLHAGSDNFLYTYDIILRRINRFRVDSEGLSYVESYSPSQESLIRLQNIYVTEWGNFGVYREMVNAGTGAEKFHFYKLDDTFNQVERLFTMNGNEKMQLGEMQHIDHLAGEKTLWDLDGEWFYHISSHNTLINKYNFRTGEQSTAIYFGLEEREITDETRQQLMKFASNIIKRFPALKETMEAVTNLPLFKEFQVYDGKVYLLIFDISDSRRTELIRIEEETEKVSYIHIPSSLWRIQAGDGVIYGIVEESPEKGSFIQKVKLGE